MSLPRKDKQPIQPTADDLAKDEGAPEKEEAEEVEEEGEEEDTPEPPELVPIQALHRMKLNPLQKKGAHRNPFSSPTDKMLSPATQKLAQKRNKLQQKIQPKFLASKLRAAALEDEEENKATKGATKGATAE
ncbi:hypothetical protein BC936DRAFT_137123 [Jimgerdemannia flammicorona]|uniref:Uncharacterized protein n=1 Tax=Jimgerdemannia flammicorona TaxID=994334 RepID=A0A433DJ81_9FUNG|nr:hypothetical protein BC936DRAFT_137123 [Jimgerdemannia flammicorona]